MGFSRPGLGDISRGLVPGHQCRLQQGPFLPGPCFPHVRPGTKSRSTNGLSGVVGSVNPLKLCAKPCEHIVIGNELITFLKGARE